MLPLGELTFCGVRNVLNSGQHKNPTIQRLVRWDFPGECCLNVKSCFQVSRFDAGSCGISGFPVGETRDGY
ncbi:hypothetical protein I7I50_09403 [Histoplasma capsulatum G186AR]|uniref:Uncharacterized protein n=1 Tax=Ajellomyces capsulatus TaxID=5037 RepID=A0A8H7YV84_AJECA|nr:hypothetical protein I7I52_06924 [Histoplasma capsulatum]QSS74292.1 hypothetical protein I7I50_09403 [Histoplasma capsulatum G186AR]